MDAQLQADLDRVIERLRTLNPYLRKGAYRKVLAPATKPLVSALKSNTPVGKKPHKRYNGSGPIEYKPGNLKKSMRALRFRRSEAVFVGPKLGSSLPDGYYAHMVEGGTINQPAQRFFERSVQATQSIVLQTAIDLFRAEIRKFGLFYRFVVR